MFVFAWTGFCSALVLSVYACALSLCAFSAGYQAWMMILVECIYLLELSSKCAGMTGHLSLDMIQFKDLIAPRD